MKQRSLTEGNITKNLIYFALPMMVGNLLQQCYNVADTLIVGRILLLLQVPEEVMPFMREYLQVIFLGIAATFLYNFFAALLRAVGNSMVPLVFLGISAVMNIVLDLVFILVLGRGVRGAAEATVLAQYVSGIGIVVYTL